MILPALLLLAITHQDIVSYADLSSGSVYIDRHSDKFLKVEGGAYVWGTPLSAVDENSGDVPQSSGKVESCSTKTFSCNYFSVFRMVYQPSSKNIFRTIKFGSQVVTIIKNGTMLHGSSVCYGINNVGCISKHQGGGPVLKYEYYLEDRKLIRLSITFFHEHGKSRYVNLILKSNRALEIQG